MRYIDEQDFDPEDYDYNICLLNHRDIGIWFFSLNGFDCATRKEWGCFTRALLDKSYENEGVITPRYVNREGKRIYPQSFKEVSHGIYMEKIGIREFDYVPGTTKEQRKKAFENVLEGFVLMSTNYGTNYVFSVATTSSCSATTEWVRYIPDGNDNKWKFLDDIERKLEMLADKQDKAELQADIEQRKQEIRARLERPNDKKYGVVTADRIAEAMISGVIEDPVTPKRGNRIAANVERKIIADKIVDKIKKGR